MIKGHIKGLDKVKGSIVFITGAGASADSGIRTYRGKDGIYNVSPAIPEILSSTAWKTHPDQVWRALRPLIKSIKENSPGPTYELMKKINEKRKIKVITQNIDGYARHATNDVYELHGTIRHMFCYNCLDEHELDEDNIACPNCSQICKPDVVLYGEEARAGGISYKGVGLVIVLGTTLQFGYLKRMIRKFKMKGAKVIHINPDKSYEVNVKLQNELWYQMKSEEALKMLFGL